MEVSKELRNDIERTQSKLKVAIRNHQILVLKRKGVLDNLKIEYEIESAQNEILRIGLAQKDLIERLRRELTVYQTTVKEEATKIGLEERRCQLTNILNRTRKQNLTVREPSVRSTSISSSISTSDDSLDIPPPSSPPPVLPLLPHELTQLEFLSRMGLCTHELFKELQSRRVERKRRSTANPHFLYGNKWDYTHKRKKNSYLTSFSPPNTRQSAKNKLKAERASSPPPAPSSSIRSDSRSNSPINNKKSIPIGLNIPNLPSGLTIERINSSNKQLMQETRVCLVCRIAGTSLNVCETCNGSYHVGCHNRPLVQQPRQCPKCLGKRDVGSLSVPSSMTVLTTYVSAAEVKEKTDEKKSLVEKNKLLKTELNTLEEQASALTISLKHQTERKEELLKKQCVTNRNIQLLLDFVNNIKNDDNMVREPPASTPSSDENGS